MNVLGGRLDCPTSGDVVEAFWPDFNCWLRAKFLRVNGDGSFSICWKSDNSTSESAMESIDSLFIYNFV